MQSRQRKRRDKRSGFERWYLRCGPDQLRADSTYDWREIGVQAIRSHPPKPRAKPKGKNPESAFLPFLSSRIFCLDSLARLSGEG